MYIRPHLESNLRHECKLVPLKEAPAGVHEHRIGDAIFEVFYSLLDIFRWHSPLNGIMEHYIEGLQGSEEEKKH